VFAEDEARLLVDSAGSDADLTAMVERRVAGEPLEHVLGWAEFCGVRIRLEASVFVPRPRSEFLVRQAVELLRPGDVVLDLCCGSGALGVAVASAVPGVRVHAVDVDATAVRCARHNLRAVGGTAYLGDLYAPLPATLRERAAVILANAPYVPTAALPLLPAEARDHEPRLALDGGDDGLDVQRRIAATAGDWLVPGGHLLVETSARQAAGTVAAVRSGGLATAVARSDELDATAVVGSRQPPA
jgi:release factor glutamine methyltransferase